MLTYDNLRLKPFIVLTFLCVYTTAIYAGGYATRRLAHIDALLASKVVNHDISRRTNSFGEVEHIGLKLFSDEIRQLNPSPTYDFLERHLLEMNICTAEDRDRLIMQYSFTFAVGGASTALKIDSTFTYTEDELEYHRYMSTWSKEGKTVMQIIYPKNWQLISGCGIRELEQNLEKQLQRHKMMPVNPLPVAGSWIVMPQMSNKLFLVQDSKGAAGGKRHYVRSVKQISHSVSNMMLADDMEHDVQIKLLVNRYNYVTDTLQVPLRLFVNYCRTVEGCVPYFGIKQRNANSTEGLLIMENKKGGFLHMISVVIDDSVIADGTGMVIGKVLPYIPIYNIKKEYLNLTEHENPN